ncbi:NPCBM/NEW2 domain-containing protein [Microvirga sp. SRT01]|uniref:Alpha-galactosidase n=1 Tax=Sphingomonas longa TaxID=2778730 RepID=A0ABS2D9S7_9SPHN|nr:MULTISPECIES: NPCBM/NEW2 domain-containing protein [Alphaproteobacteria]MBM6577648.1 NPCBM/NEW2 domain-containing protein [Sphingomonas sp. BT552]MBR7710691.1 NPCBM/NEW2 domain-containing protein [Microvirga sp. SRT01]
MRLSKTTAAVFTAMMTLPVVPAQAQQDTLAPTGRWSTYTAGRAQTPPMGWSSWNAFATDIDESKILGSAEALVRDGLAAKGYRYVNIDDGWALQRRVRDGALIIRPGRFPITVQSNADASFRPLTDRLHGMGLKAGIYSDLGRNTCSQAYSPDDTDLPKGSVLEREIGLYGHIDQDIDLFFAKWGFDFIKVDGCGLRAFGADAEKVRSGKYRALPPILNMDFVNRSDIPAVQALFGQINAALARDNPDGDYLLSLCIWGAADVRSWGKNVGNISRTSDDINPSWGRMLTNFDTAAKRAFYAHPGSWNDPDMLFIGKGDFDADHLTEARSHMTMWAMINAPLMIGMDLRQAPRSLLDIFGNAQVIALDQDPAGHQAIVAFDSDDVQIFVKTLSTGEKAVAIFNRGAASLDVDLTAAQMKFRDDADVKLVDLWSGERRSFRATTKLKIQGHQTLLFRANGTRVLTDGLYLSEQPGNVNPAVDGVVEPMPDPTIHRSATGWQGTRGTGEGPIYAGWGGAQADRAPFGEVLAIKGARFDTGVGVLANSRLEVRNQGYRRFTAVVGINDSARDTNRAATFAVYGDGKLLATSRALKWGDPGQLISADVTGVRIVELVTRANGSNAAPLPTSWADAALMKR